MPKDFLDLDDWSPEELLAILARARELKALLRKGERPQTLLGRTMAMYFEHPSLRTHVTFEAGMTQLGGHAIFLSPEQVGVGTRESPRDVALNLSRWVDVIVARTASHTLALELARAASIPVINGLTDLAHPCQAMADLLTISERVPLERASVAYVGDGNNVANSLLIGAALLGVELRLGTPESHRPALRVRQAAERLAARSGARLALDLGPERGGAGRGLRLHRRLDQHGPGGRSRRAPRAVRGLPGERAAAPPRPRGLRAPLPARPPRARRSPSDVLDGPRSLVLDQAENRLHAQKAILERVILAPRD